MKHVSELELRAVRVCPTCQGERPEGQACASCLGAGKVQVNMSIGELASHLSIWYTGTPDGSE